MVFLARFTVPVARAIRVRAGAVRIEFLFFGHGMFSLPNHAGEATRIPVQFQEQRRTARATNDGNNSSGTCSDPKPRPILIAGLISP